MEIIIGIIVVFIIYKLATSPAGKHNLIKNEVKDMLGSGHDWKTIDYMSWDSFCDYAKKVNLTSTNPNPKNKFDHTEFYGNVVKDGKQRVITFTRWGDGVHISLDD